MSVLYNILFMVRPKTYVNTSGILKSEQVPNTFNIFVFKKIQNVKIKTKYM